jgi:hypothetical protein
LGRRAAYIRKALDMPRVLVEVPEGNVNILMESDIQKTSFVILLSDRNAATPGSGKLACRDHSIEKNGATNPYDYVVKCRGKISCLI